MTEHDDMRRGRPFRSSASSVFGEFALIRAAASVVWCPYCGAAPDSPCVRRRTEVPIQHFPAHQARVNAAEARAEAAR